MIKDKLKELLNEFKKSEIREILVLEYEKRNDRRIFYSSTKLTSSDSDIDKYLNPCIKVL